MPLAAGGVLGIAQPYVNSRGVKSQVALVEYENQGELVQSVLGAGGVQTSGSIAMDSQQRVMTVSTGSEGSSWMRVCRIHAGDGTVDSSFGGATCSEVTGLPTGYAEAVIVLPSGAVLAGMNASPAVLVQLTASGARDSQFGTDGVLLLEQNTTVESLAVQSDGRILVSLKVWTGGFAQPKVIRLMPAGGLDPSFGNGGMLPDVEGSLLVRADDTFLALSAEGISAYLPNGTLDERFGTNGTVNLKEATGTVADMFSPRAVTQDASGRIYVGAVFKTGGRDGGLVSRLSPTGKLDPEFSARTESEAPITWVGSALTIAADGKLWVMLSVGEGDSIQTGLALLQP
ncbi:NHL repeat-containing protein [Myxococcus qinghaiensis]|uniref:hypothetical protein n=1 Tax=Myxococcus qinghaiensis TaxID=2906758 RepID=UPI0020A7BAFA|nr:hypothetical protein [Myxococcus qinghaiensis]MCP3166405.1 hypothetical protein [Myxococcus qinghaiensis]